MIRRVLPIFGLVALVAGCAAIPTRASPGPPAGPESIPVASPASAPSVPAAGPDRVVALVGTVGAMSLVAAEPDAGITAIAGSPVPATAAWLSGDGSTFVVTTFDGRVLTGPLDGLAPAPGELGGPHLLRAFGALDPESTSGGTPGVRKLAFVAGDPGSGGPGTVSVVRLDGRIVRTIPLSRPAESQPAWLPDGRLAVISRDRGDRPEVVLVDPANGRITIVASAPLRSLGTAAGLVATIEVDGSVHLGPVGTWLGGHPLARVPSDPAEGPALLAEPSPDGRELAVVLADGNGDAASIRILAVEPAWHEIARFELPPGANRAVVSWQAVR